MEALRFNSKKNTYTVTNYPHTWGEKVPGIADHITWYEIEETDKPDDYDSRTQTATLSWELTETQGKFLNIAKQVWTITPNDSSDVSDYLNNTLGIYLDENYLTETRIKHVYELQCLIKIGEDNFTDTQQARYDYLNSLMAWVVQCTELRDEYEEIFTSEGTLPELSWPDKPVNS